MSDDKHQVRVVPKDDALKERLLNVCKSVGILNSISAAALESLVGALFRVEYDDGFPIVKQGDQPDNFYILDEGKCKVLKTVGGVQTCVATLVPGQYFGELALLSASTRAATVVAVGHVVLWAIDQNSYLYLVRQTALEKRRKYKMLLSNIPLMQNLSDYQILLVVDALKEYSPAKDEVIVKEGEKGEMFYVIIKGECVVSKNGVDKVRLKEGAYFGEMALLNNDVRAATVRACEGCKLVTLDRTAFDRLLGPCTDFLKERMDKYQKLN